MQTTSPDASFAVGNNFIVHHSRGYTLPQWIISQRWAMIPLAVIMVLAAVAAVSINLHDLTFDGASILLVLGACMGIYLLGFLAQWRVQGSLIAMSAQAFGLLLALSLLASVAPAAMTPGSGPLIDVVLVRADRAIMPWWEWRKMIEVLSSHQWLMGCLSYVYLSIIWQPTLILLVAGVTGQSNIIARFVCMWSLSIALCILPFRWLTALGPYAYYGIGEDAVPKGVVGLPFHFPRILQGLQSAEITVISRDTITGLVSFPSFHACAAIVLASTFGGWGKKAWPMVALNIVMIASAVPIGGHYFIDIIAGCMAGLVAIYLTTQLEPSAGQRRV